MSDSPSALPLFVYGTLRKGSANPHAVFLHSRCRYTGTARMPGRLFRSATSFGALYEPGTESRVLGDLLELPAAAAQEILTSLDRYEGIGAGMPKPHPYRRDVVQVEREDGLLVQCWTWLYNLPTKGCSILRHGDALSRE